MVHMAPPNSRASEVINAEKEEEEEEEWQHSLTRAAGGATKQKITALPTTIV